MRLFVPIFFSKLTYLNKTKEKTKIYRGLVFRISTFCCCFHLSMNYQSVIIHMLGFDQQFEMCL